MGLSQSDLLRAFRQAKTALSDERSGVSSEAIATFEENLGANILAMTKLRQRRTRSDSLNGQPIVVVKDSSAGRLSLQIQLQQSMESAIGDVEWLWKFGAALEAQLDESCVANRLKLVGNSATSGPRHLFKPWRYAYREFHKGIRDTARSILESKRPCTIYTFDIRNYYGSIDSRFLVSDEFLATASRMAKANGRRFQPSEYRTSTQQLLARIATFNRDASKLSGVKRSPYGLPIGAISSRLIANLALAKLDGLARRRKGVFHYARWVDDIVVVAVEGQGVKSSNAAKRFLPMKSATTLDGVALSRPTCRFELHPDKMRQFFLQGEEGLDMLHSLGGELDGIGSYRGAFGAALDRTEQRQDLLELVRTPTDLASGAFQYIDAIKIRRAAAYAVIGKVVEATLLTSPEGQKERATALRAMVRTLRKEEQWSAFVDIALRVLGAAATMGDDNLCQDVVRLVNGWRNIVVESDLATLDGRRATRRVRELCSEHIGDRLRQLLASSVRPATAGAWLADAGEPARILEKARQFARADLRLLDQAEDRRLGGFSFSRVQKIRVSRLDTALRTELSLIGQFLSAATTADDVEQGASALDVWLSRRPPSVFDISWSWARAHPSKPVPPFQVVNAVRGTNYWKEIADVKSSKAGTAVVPLYRLPERQFARVVLGNMVTRLDWASDALRGKSVCNSDRLVPIVQVVDAVRRLRRNHEHTLLVLPELSVPRAILRQLVAALVKEEIGLVAGLEYERKGSRISNEVIAVIPQSYGVCAIGIWRKVLPAVGEEADALRALGLKFARGLRAPGALVLDSQFGALSVLICSELLEIEARARLPGRIDLLLVPSWNTDTTSFDPVIAGTALDVHCFVGVANNSVASDSRLRGPMKKAHMRDLCRLIEREENAVVSSRALVTELRAFQRGETGPGEPLFKPVPPGFKYRRPRPWTWPG